MNFLVCLSSNHETLCVVQQVRILPGQGGARPSR